MLGYNGLFPGPTIRATRGRDGRGPPDQPDSGRDLNVHLHGGVTEPQFDGHPHDAIATGTERLYEYPNVARSATLWYHDHAHGETRQDAVRRAGRRSTSSTTRTTRRSTCPQGDYDVPLMIQDRSFNADGSFRYRFDLDRGFRGDTILVNGAVAPRMKVERRLYRLRFLNASNARPYALELGNGRKMIQIASDGGMLPGKPVARTVDPAGAGRARRRARRLPPVRRRLEGHPAQHRRRAVDAAR